MTRRAYSWWFTAIIVVSAVLSYRANSDWDYPEDAGPTIDALIHGRLHDFLAGRPLMGPVSLIVRAPFAALSLFTEPPGYHFYNDAYRFGIFPCLVIAGLLGVYLARLARESGLPPIVQIALGGLCLVNEASLKAIVAGHPEEILGAALCVAAMLAGLAKRPILAVVLLALAVGTKQWAVIAIVPVALTLDAEARVRAGKVAAGLIALILVPFLIAGPASLWDMTRQLADIRHASILPADVWWAFRTKDGTPDWLGVIAHPLLIAVCAGVALLYAKRVREDPFGRALPLLALVLLLRCMLDPLDNAYYHVPFYMAVLAADAVSGRFAASLVATAALWATTQYGTSVTAVHNIYLAWTLPFVVYLAGRAYGLDWAALIRRPGPRTQPGTSRSRGARGLAVERRRSSSSAARTR